VADDRDADDVATQVGVLLFDRAEEFAVETARSTAEVTKAQPPSSEELYRLVWETAYFLLHATDRIASSRGREGRDALMAVIEPAALFRGVISTCRLDPASTAFQTIHGQHADTIAQRHRWYAAMRWLASGEGYDGDLDHEYGKLAAATVGHANDFMWVSAFSLGIGLRQLDLQLPQVVNGLLERLAPPQV
jgi:hypothetical protein